MIEVIFVVEDAPEGGFTARALGESIFTEAETVEELRNNVKEAVECHFDPETMPKIIRLHMVKEELIAI
jgi:predicted RNase H-like HicB family nuclease